MLPTVVSSLHERQCSSSSSATLFLDEAASSHYPIWPLTNTYPAALHNLDFQHYAVGLSSPTSNFQTFFSSRETSDNGNLRHVDEQQPLVIEGRLERGEFTAFSDPVRVDRGCHVDLNDLFDFGDPQTATTSPETSNITEGHSYPLAPSTCALSDIFSSRNGSKSPSPTTSIEQNVAPSLQYGQRQWTSVRRNAICPNTWEEQRRRSHANVSKPFTLMSMAELEANGWYSHWPHHSCRNATTTASMDSQPAFLPAASTKQNTSRPSLNDVDDLSKRQFFEVKCPVQTIPKFSDPTRFQQNGRCLIACDACKRRKMRCTNEVPTCANCTRRGTECSYAEKVRTRGRAKTTGRPGLAGSILDRKRKKEEIGDAKEAHDAAHDGVLTHIQQHDTGTATNGQRKQRRLK